MDVVLQFGHTLFLDRHVGKKLVGYFLIFKAYKEENYGNGNIANYEVNNKINQNKQLISTKSDKQKN